MNPHDDDFAQRLSLGWVTASREDMLFQLNQVLAAEKAKTAELAQLLKKERRRTSDLEAMVQDFNPDMSLSESCSLDVIRKESSLSSVEMGSSCDEGNMGLLPLQDRQQKLARYKWKRLRRMQRAPVSRSFTGRSVAAQNRQRVRGRFARAAAEP